MSDFISNGEQYLILYNGIPGKSNRSSYVRYSGELDNRNSLLDREGGITVKENIYNRGRRSYHPSERFRLNSPLDDGNSAQACSDASYVEELERLSSSLIQLLSNAIPESLKVKPSDGMSQPSLHQYVVRSQGGSTPRCHHAGRQDMQNLTNSKTCKDSDFHEATLQTDPDVRKLMQLSGSTIEAPNSTSVSYPTEELTSTAGTDRRRLPTRGLDSRRHDTHKANDRQKKDIHNKVEKRRRTNINDRITELGTLLPEYIGRTSCQKKGSILKESVDYIKKLKSDLCRLKQLEDKMKETNIEVQKLGFKLKQLELAISPLPADNVDTYQVQNKTRAQYPIFNSRTTLSPVTRTKRDHSNSDSLEFRSDVFTALSQTLQSDGICVDSAISAPSSSEEDIDDLDCYL